jgi:outer membrane protein OmpA-like peptidoglycan-associated protein
MILFDFDNAEISAGNAEILRFIASRIKPESAVTITGYTDSRGADEYLRTLSLRRANAAKAALGRSDATTLGFGKDAVIYDNDLPEGRFYCRTVVIEAKTPIR